MKIRRGKIDVHNEPPAVLLVDIAFNLLIFFVVCALTEPQEGRKQEIPGSEKTAQAPQQQQAENIDVAVAKTTASINGSPVRQADFVPRLKELLKGRDKPEQRIVVVKSSPDVPYDHWIDVTVAIEEAGGVITLQLEESREVQVQ